MDVAQNPNDTEESIWCFLCEAQLYGVDEARRRYLEVNQQLAARFRTVVSFPRRKILDDRMCSLESF